MEQLSKTMEDMGFLWSSCRSKYIWILVRDTSACRGLVHNNPVHCFQHFFIKLFATGKVASKYYIFFHLIPLILRLKRLKDIKDLPKTVGATLY